MRTAVKDILRDTDGRAVVLTRAIAWLGFFAVCLGSWWMLYQSATSMQIDLLGFPRMPMDGMAMEGMAAGEMAAGTMSETGMASASAMMDSGMSGSSMTDGAMTGDMASGGMMMDMSSFGPLFGMWSIMMAAMMLPTFVPTARVFTDLIEAGLARPIGFAGFVWGYSAIWVGVAALLAAVQVALLQIGLIGGMGQSLSPWFSAGLLIIAGLYQFTALKDRCASYCRNPMTHILAGFRPGLRGGARLGLVVGVYCAGCCWGLMAIGFAGGMMSLLWMGLATFLMVLEKLPAIGVWLTAPIGIALIGLGLWVGLAAL
ncbi:DUF2182 domain-containing protein [Pontivivens ytuae]|uniref:DUF2182 domain-containing protein n=1 Tax=Pontivivens ytuae TaxID=2789856 RepID=A0A7S9LQX8_9RHOB|nr:DUF2182 domain-containing protein [Pontivivens ytuae]QPH53486.1 DUF2182 domain-containing protein [Pontivivens ytuae]